MVSDRFRVLSFKRAQRMPELSIQILRNISPFPDKTVKNHYERYQLMVMEPTIARGDGHPRQILELIREFNCGNPIMLLDEIDKASSSSWNGRIQDTLLTLQEPSSAKSF